jgi:tRNA U34 5-carboxymethylaminomethyl modifying enzyme MnmG/GidA
MSLVPRRAHSFPMGLHLHFWFPDTVVLRQCYKTYTTEVTHKIVMDNAHLLPDYDGDDGKGVGPR